MVKAYKVGAHISKEPDLILEEQLILTPGFWGGVKFTDEEIQKGISRTDWSDKEISRLLQGHVDLYKLPSAEQWIGDIKNVRYLTIKENSVEKDGMYCDMDIFDSVVAKKIAYGKAKLGFSIDANYNNTRFGAVDLSFADTALVSRGGCKDAVIQLEDKGDNFTTRIYSDELNVKLEGEIDSESSEGNSGDVNANQPILNAKLEDIKTAEDEIKLGDRVEVYNLDFENMKMGRVVGMSIDEKDELHFAIKEDSEDEEILSCSYLDNYIYKVEESAEKIQLMYSNTARKGDKQKTIKMKDKLNTSNVKLDAALEATPVAAPVVETPVTTVTAPVVEAPVAAPVAAPVVETPVAPVAPVVEAPVVEVPVVEAPATPAENPAITALTAQVKALTEIITAQNVKPVAQATPVVETPVTTVTTPVVATPSPTKQEEVIKMPAQSKTIAFTEDSNSEYAGMSKFEKGLKELNRKTH